MSTAKRKRKFTKKEKRWAIVGLIFVVIVLAIFLSIAIPYFAERKRTGFNGKYKYDGVSLIGKWQEKDLDNGAYKIYDFQENGKVITTIYVYGMEKVKDVESTYRIEDKNTLVISYPVGGVVQSSRTPFSISDDGSTLVLKNGKNNYTILEEHSLNYNKDPRIFGEWVNTANPSEIYTLNEDYTGKMVDEQGANNIVFSTNGDDFYYFIDGYMQIEGYTLSAEFVIDGKYTIDENTLTLTVGDKAITFTRK